MATLTKAELTNGLIKEFTINLRTTIYSVSTSSSSWPISLNN